MNTFDTFSLGDPAVDTFSVEVILAPDADISHSDAQGLEVIISDIDKSKLAAGFDPRGSKHLSVSGQ